jgi:hypothetical protein
MPAMRGHRQLYLHIRCLKSLIFSYCTFPKDAAYKCKPILNCKYINTSFIILKTEYNSLRSEGRRPLWRPRSRWEDNIKMDLQEVGWDMDWIELAHDRDRWWPVVDAVMNFRVP